MTYESNYSWEDEDGWVRYGILTEAQAKEKKNPIKYSTAWESQNYAYRQNMKKVDAIGVPERSEGVEPLVIDGAEKK